MGQNMMQGIVQRAEGRDKIAMTDLLLITGSVWASGWVPARAIPLAEAVKA